MAKIIQFKNNKDGIGVEELLKDLLSRVDDIRDLVLIYDENIDREFSNYTICAANGLEADTVNYMLDAAKIALLTS